MQGINAFDQHASEYDRWFDEHDLIYQSEVNALRKCIPRGGNGIEIGIGSGRFSVPFGIRLGVEPSRAMSYIAHGRGVTVARHWGNDCLSVRISSTLSSL